jgi:serine/threonine protein kinase
MGVVFRAEDPQLERVVALKAMLPALARTPLAKQRFFREAKAAAALKHPNIVTIFQVGEDGGVPFLAMEFLNGESLDAHLKRQGKLAVTEVLRIGQEVAAGLAAAHEQGLIHRDIKPANLWLEPRRGLLPTTAPDTPARTSNARSGDTAPDRLKAIRPTVVKILDFGLARTVADQVHLTQSGAIVGTPAYMAPEQAEGAAVDQRCDLFSLGVVLYRMCTGEMPFKGATTLEILSALALHRPAPPQTLNPEVPVALSDLVMRLLAKKPHDRPASAQEVVDALRAVEQDHVEGRPSFQAERQPSGASRAAVWPRSKKSLSWLVPVAVGSVVLVIGVLLVAVVAFWTILHRAPTPDPDLGNEPVNVQVVATPPNYRDHPPGLIWSTPAGSTWWWCASFSPRGDYVAAGEDGRPNVDSENLNIRIWPIKEGQMGKDSFVLRHPRLGKSWLSGMAFSPDGRRLASGAFEGSICLWDMEETPSLFARLPRFDGIITGLAFSPNGKYFAAGARQLGSPVCVWDLTHAAGPKEVYTFTPKDEISALIFSPDSQTLFIGTGRKDIGGQLYAWRYGSESTATMLWSKPRVKDSGLWVRALDITWDGTQLGVAFADKGYLIDPKTGAERVTLIGHASDNPVQGIAFSRDGKRCVTASYDRTIRAWSTQDGKQIWQNTELTGLNEGVGLSPDGRLAFTSSHIVNNPAGNVVQLWRLPEPEQPADRGAPQSQPRQD